MDKTQQGTVEATIHKGIATITFSHPAHNSLPGRLLAQLANTITEMGNDSAVNVIILKSGGDRTFCAGASFDELASIEDLATGKRFFMGFANVINACRKCPKLIIGRVQGKAVGGGVGVASAVDYCMATQYAAVRLSELAVGIGPFVVGPAVARKVGDAAMAQMSMTPAEWQPASWALEKGLYAKVFDNTEALDEAVGSLAEELSQYHPEAMRLLKQVFWKGTEDWDELLEARAAMSGELVLSCFSKEAIAAFKAR